MRKRSRREKLARLYEEFQELILALEEETSKLTEEEKKQFFY